MLDNSWMLVIFIWDCYMLWFDITGRQYLIAGGDEGNVCGDDTMTEVVELGWKHLQPLRHCLGEILKEIFR